MLWKLCLPCNTQPLLFPHSLIFLQVEAVTWFTKVHTATPQGPTTSGRPLVGWRKAALPTPLRVAPPGALHTTHLTTAAATTSWPAPGPPSWTTSSLPSRCHAARSVITIVLDIFSIQCDTYKVLKVVHGNQSDNHWKWSDNHSNGSDNHCKCNLSDNHCNLSDDHCNWSDNYCTWLDNPSNQSWSL